MVVSIYLVMFAILPFARLVSAYVPTKASSQVEVGRGDASQMKKRQIFLSKTCFPKTDNVYYVI